VIIFRPSGALSFNHHVYPRLAPWATFFRPSGAWL
jgi:hypothetical protein